MRNLFILSVLIFHVLVSTAIGASLQSNNIQVKVMDESGLPLDNVKVSIDGSEYFISNGEGKFSMNPKSELVMPFDVVIIKSGFKMKEFSFNESDNKIEVILKKVKLVKEEETIVTINDVNNKPLRNTKVVVDGKNFISDNKGNISIKGAISEKSSILIIGYELSGVTFNEKEHVIKISADKKKVENNAIEPPKEELWKVKDNITEGKLNQQQLNEKVYKQYQNDFDALTNEIIAERIRVEGNNQKIRDEISGITNRLQNEKNLSAVQRKGLQKYLEKLESSLLENTIAFEKSQERTSFLVQKLKTIIMEKDSININAMKKIALVEKESRKTERKFRRNIIVFSIITAALLLLAIVFYSIAIKMKKQRRELIKANESMHGIKDQLTKSLQELQSQRELVAEQKRKLDSLR